MKYLVESHLGGMYITDDPNTICFNCSSCGDSDWPVGNWRDDDPEGEADVVWLYIQDQLDLPQDIFDFIISVDDLDEYVAEIQDSHDDIIEELNYIGVSKAAMGIVEDRWNSIEDDIRDVAAQYGIVPYDAELLATNFAWWYENSTLNDKSKEYGLEVLKNKYGVVI
jgi:hypothetical protein